MAGCVVAAFVAGAAAFWWPTASGGAAVDPAVAREMALSERLTGTTPAPDITLVDQRGRPFDLRSLRGRPVVLTFLDPHCTDVCPIISAEFAQADRLLAEGHHSVAFVAVNVNPYATATTDAAAYLHEHGLDDLGDFTFATGSAASLATVWKHYGVYVQAPDPSADVVHTSVTYFIDRAGVIRYVATPNVDHRADGSSYLPTASIADWATGISQVSASL